MKSSLGNKSVMAANLARYIEAKGISRQKLCDDLDFRYSTLSDWLHARTYPRIDKIEQMAEYFGVTKADLIEEPSHFSGDSDAQRLADLLQQKPLLADTARRMSLLSESDLNYVRDLIDRLSR